jgi:beta-galactosidase
MQRINSCTVFNLWYMKILIGNNIMSKCKLVDNAFLYMVTALSIFVTGNIFAATVQPEASGRVVQNLNMNWKFFLNTPAGNPQDSAYNDAAWANVCLPSPLIHQTSHLNGSTDCNNQATFDRNTGWYRRHFALPNQQNKKVFVSFQTVMQVATVYVNGKLVGIHERSGYDSFHFDITSFVSFTGDNVISVKVDNTINVNSPPDDKYTTTCTNYPSGMDFVLFGGINGDVSLVCTDNVHIGFQWESTTSGIAVTTPNFTTSSAAVNIKVSVKNESTSSRNVTVVGTIVDANNNVVGTPVTSAVQSIAANTSGLFDVSTIVSSPLLWDIDNPNLYKLYVSVHDGATPVDSLWTRFGIRSIAFSATTGFTLNGKSVKLIGVNRHSAWPFVGGAIPNTVHRREARQIKDCGFNWIRLSHYPHDPEFLDALDELGILGLEEAPTWAHAGGTIWLTNMQESFRREIRRDKNHPCIMTWNANINHLNCDATLQSIASTEDPSRTAACYNGTLPANIPSPMCFAAIDNANAAPSITGGGGLCIEHTGHTWRTPRFLSTTWPNEFRLLIHSKRHWEEVGDAKITAGNSGIAAWVMYDYNSFHNSGIDGANGTSATNARNIVFHGLFDLYRIPKFAAYWYKAELTAAPMIFIADYWMTSRAQNDTVTIFSNCDSVELIVNGVSKGVKAPDRGNTYRAALKHPPFFFSGVTYASGSLIAKGRIAGQVVAVDTVRTPGTAAKLKIETDPDTLIADGADFGRVIVSVCDASGTVIPTASNSISMTAGGAGRIISDNPIPAESGKIIFLAQADTVGGTITVTASSGTLTTATKTITVIKPSSVGILHGSQVQQSSCVMLNHPRFFKSNGSRIMLPDGIAKLYNSIEVFDVRGKLVLKTALLNNTTMIDVSKAGKAEGVFIVKAQNELR